MSELQLQSCYTGYIGFLSREALVVKSLPLSLCFSLSLSLALYIYILTTVVVRIVAGPWDTGQKLSRISNLT